MVGHAGEEGRRGQLHLLVSRIQKGGRQRRDKTEDLSTLYKELDNFSLWSVWSNWSWPGVGAVAALRRSESRDAFG